MIVRARRVQGREDDSVVKLRPVVPDELPGRAAPLAGHGRRARRDAGRLRLLGDAEGPARHVATSSSASAASATTRKLFSKAQRAFYKEHAPDGLELDDLTLLGPIFVLKLNSTPQAFKRKLTTEMWLYPDGSRILELSTKCAPTEMFQVAVEARAFLAGLGIDLSGQQQTKTKTALQQFSRNLGTG